MYIIRHTRPIHVYSLNKKDWICSLRVNLEWTFVLFTHFGVTSGITRNPWVNPVVTPKWVNNTNVHSKFTLISHFSKIHSLKSEHINSFLFREYRREKYKGPHFPRIWLCVGVVLRMLPCIGYKEQNSTIRQVRARRALSQYYLTMFCWELERRCHCNKSMAIVPFCRLVLNGTSLNNVNALLVLNRRIMDLIRQTYGVYTEDKN